MEVFLGRVQGCSCCLFFHSEQQQCAEPGQYCCCPLSPGVSPSGPGVVVMQLNVPNGPQPPQNAPVVQWSHCKYYSLDQRGQKPGDLYNPDTSAQVLRGLGGRQLIFWEQPGGRKEDASIHAVCVGWEKGVGSSHGGETGSGLVPSTGSV